MGRPTKTAALITDLGEQHTTESRQEIGTGMFIPNHSGDLSAGRVLRTPSNDKDPVSKDYVSNAVSKAHDRSHAVMTAADHSDAATVLASHPHQDVNTTASPQFANVIVTAGGDIKPSSNSTTAINIAQADGTNFVTFDTTNKRIGIKTTPSSSFDCAGDAYIGHHANPRIRITNTSGTAANLLAGADSGVTFLGAESNCDMYLIANNSEKMRIKAAGQVSIGENASTATLNIKQIITSGYGVKIWRDLDSNSTDSPLFYVLNDNSGDDRTCAQIQQDAPNAALYLDQNNSNVGLRIDKDVASSAGVEYAMDIASDVAAGGGSGAGIDLSAFSAGEITVNFPAGNASTKNPAVDAPEGWINIAIGGVVKYIPYYAA